MFKHRKATLGDLGEILHLLLEDELGATREHNTNQLEKCYIDAFQAIHADPNQYLMVVEKDEEILGTCHLTIMPSLTFMGSTRMQIKAVRVKEKYRGQSIGAWMMNEAILYGQSKGAKIVQLTTNKKRLRAQRFYKSLGFEPSHEGMKMYVGEHISS